MNLKALREKEYIKCVDLLSEMIDLDAGAREIVHKRLQNMGIKNFFLNLDSVELSPEAIEKLKSIKAIIELSNVKRGRA